MNDKIDISIIIPMYNSEKYIEKALTSIVNQEKHSLKYEIIVVDDGSKDNSVDVVRDLKNGNIRLIILDKNGGLSNARNTGLKIAKGEWIQFVDSDDEICIDLYKKFENSLASNINCYIFSLVCEYPNYILKQTITGIKDKRAFAYFGGVWNKFIKRDICIEFKKDYLFEDNIFNIEMMKENNLKIALIEDAYYIYNCKNVQSIIANFNKKEFIKMYSYIYSQIENCDDLTKMYILEIFVALIFNKNRPFFMSLQIATKTVIRLFKYLPKVYINQNRHSVKNIITKL